MNTKFEFIDTLIQNLPIQQPLKAISTDHLSYRAEKKGEPKLSFFPNKRKLTFPFFPLLTRVENITDQVHQHLRC